jgi:probable rRNA maturation factor
VSSTRRRAPLSLAVQYASSHDAPSRAQCRRWASAACRALGQGSAELTLRFVDSKEARSLNRSFRRRDYATNVLTFDYQDTDVVHADIVVCVPVIEREARQQKKDLRAHFAHMVVHGVLHAYGLDHEIASEADRMEALERTILAAFRIADPYA